MTAINPTNVLPMWQAKITTPTTFTLESVPRPRLQNSEEVLLRTAVSGICSGDLMPWYLQKKVGTVLGHEIVGHAVEVGSAVRHIRPGDLVFVHHHAPCLECEHCRRGQHVHCAAWRGSAIDPGGMAEYVRVPALNVQNDCFAVNDLTPEQAVFIEPLACSVKALRRVPAFAGRHGVVVGCGVMGLLNLAAARALGSSHLTAVEPDTTRRSMALVCGADHALTPEEAGRQLQQQADFVIIGPGFPEVIQQALQYVRSGGVAVLFTPTATGVLTPLDLGELYFREVTLAPSYSCGPDDTRQAAGLLRSGAVNPLPIVTHRFALSGIQEGFDTARRGGTAVKVLITFPE